ncbi:MAG: NAD-binding protein [Saprospiraceae bacterium]
MKIIIAGAGDVGFHLAELLAYENQDITLIDMDQDVLDYASTHLDVLTIRGDCGSVNILESAGAKIRYGAGGYDQRKNESYLCYLGKKDGATARLPASTTTST